jgi:hypothetical protein
MAQADLANGISTPASTRPHLSDTTFRIFESTAVARSGVLALLFSVAVGRLADSGSIEAADFASFLCRLKPLELLDRPV